MSPSRRNFLAAGAAAAATPFAAAADAPPLKFQLGVVTYNIAAKWDLPTLLGILKRTKVTGVEFRTTHPHGVEPTLTSGERADVKKRCADAGVTIWGLGSVCEFHAVDPAEVAGHVETCRRFVGLAADLGARGVKVRPNGLRSDVPAEKTLEQIGKALVPCGRAAADAGVEIWVEVHGEGTKNPPAMKAIMEQCGHAAVGVCWNSNPTDVKGGSVKESFELLKPWLKSCHINELYRDADGRYPYRELFALLRGAGYDRYTLCEVAKTPPDAASGEELLRYYRALWMELTRG
jgi:sugar phosphate isomerase/epimerase